MAFAAGHQIELELLRPYQKRRFVSQQVCLTDRGEVAALHTQLLERNIASWSDLERWVLDRSELEAALDQQGAVLFIRMTCQTDDANCAHKYRQFIETVIPAVKPIDNKLNRKFLIAIDQFPPKGSRYEVYIRAIRADTDLFMEKNIELQTKIDLLSQEYQALCGSMTVEFQDKERTMPEMGKFLLETDRDLRERAWRGATGRRLQDKERLDQLFDQMLKLREGVSQNAGFPNFRDYSFKAFHRFDYTPQDCRLYHQNVERFVVPLWSKILKRRRTLMGLDRLRPWDTAVDPSGHGPLKPFEKIEDLINGCRDVFGRVDGHLGKQFQAIVGDGLLDLSSRKGKAPGGYQSTLSEARKPFIFMNAVGVDSDVRTLLHESGHAFHALASAHDPLLDYRRGPMEFNEVASMGIELLAGDHLGVFYNKEDLHRSHRTHLEDIVFTFTWVATVDAFQHWIYENPRRNALERCQMWKTIYNRFSGGVVDWDGLDDARGYLWHRQLHMFEVPFYYIEYGIAQLGALQLWLNSQRDWSGTLERYRRALSLGGSRPLPELFKAAGLHFDFSEKAIVPLVDAIDQKLDAMARS